jgi:hypothetical protein
MVENSRLDVEDLDLKHHIMDLHVEDLDLLPKDALRPILSEEI